MFYKSKPLVSPEIEKKIQTLREPPVKRKDLQALTLSGPPRENPVLDPLAVLHLDNQLCVV